MKKLITLVALSALCYSCGGPKTTVAEEEKMVWIMTGFREPADTGLRFIYSYDGWNWEDLGVSTFLRPEVGTAKIMRDPSIVATPDGVYHLVWTSSWRDDLGIGYAYSRDLINWSDQRHIVLMDKFPNIRNTWAPELFYDEEHEEFSIAWSSSSPDLFDGTQRQYYTLTHDFFSFTEPEVFYDPGYNSIDGAVMKRGENDYVLCVKDNRKPGYSNLHLAFGPTPVGPWSGETESFGPEYSEGPTWVEVDEGWLIYYDAYKQYRYGAHLTTDFQSFTDVSDRISVPKNHKHGTAFRAPERILEGLKAEAERIRAAEAAAHAEIVSEIEVMTAD